jgi:hypothetical protein
MSKTIRRKKVNNELDIINGWFPFYLTNYNKNNALNHVKRDGYFLFYSVPHWFNNRYERINRRRQKREIYKWVKNNNYEPFLLGRIDTKWLWT